MSPKDSFTDDPYPSILPTSPQSQTPGRYLKKRKHMAKHPNTNSTRLIVFLLTLLIFISYTLTTSHKQLTRFNLSTLAHKYILKQPLEEITETLAPSVLSMPVILLLIEEASIYPKAKILLSNHEAYPDILLELAANRPETLDFVINYARYETSTLSTNSISIDHDFNPGSIPLFLQWDERWGYESYGTEFIASSACGPTALSMVAVGLTGNTNMHPKTISDLSYNLGYFHAGQGTSWGLMSEGAKKLGLNSKELPLDTSIIYKALDEGHPIIASMKPGHFTKAGHFIVLTGTTPDGKIQVNDPGSLANSKIAWDLSVIMNEAKNLWAFSAV